MLSLWRGIAATGGARVFSLLATMAILVATARVLGPVGRGQFAAAITWATLVSTLGYLSLGQVALHRAGQSQDRTWLGPVLASLMVVTGAICALGWMGATAAYVLTEGRLYGGLPAVVLAAGMAALPFLVWEQYGSSLLMAIDRLSVYNRAQIVGRTVGVLGAVVLLVVGWGVAGALLGGLLGQAVVAVAGLRVLREEAGEHLRWHWRTTRSLLVGGVKLHLNAVGTFLFAQASVLLVQYYRGAEETGYFQLALQLISVAMLLPQAATFVLYSIVAKEGPDRAWPANRRILLVLSAGMTAAAAVAALLAPLVFPLVLGEDFRPAVPVFQLLTATLLGQTMAAVMAAQWIGRGLFWQVSLFTAVTGVVNLTASLLLIPTHGMYGAAWAVMGTYAISVVGNGAFALHVQHRVSRADLRARRVTADFGTGAGKVRRDVRGG